MENCHIASQNPSKHKYVKNIHILMNKNKMAVSRTFRPPPPVIKVWS